MSALKEARRIPAKSDRKSGSKGEEGGINLMLLILGLLIWPVWLLIWLFTSFGDLARALHHLVSALVHLVVAPLMLVEAASVAGRTLTSRPSLRTDLVNAGAQWVNAAVVQDGNLLTSRRPADLDAFCATLLERLDGTRRRAGGGEGGDGV